MTELPYRETYFRIGDRVILTDTSGASFDFTGAGLLVGQSRGIVAQLPDTERTSVSVLVEFDGIGFPIAIKKTRLLLENPLERMAREI